MHLYVPTFHVLTIYLYMCADLSKWAAPDGQGMCCPICQTLLQAGEVQSHLAKELAELKIM